MHLIVDTHCKNQALMRDIELLRDWLFETSKLMGMTVYGEPIVVDFPFPQDDSTALSAICFLGESSITIHTYPERGFSFIDLFSCKDFNFNLLKGHIVRSFQATNPHLFLMDRGVNFETGEIIPVHPSGKDIE